MTKLVIQHRDIEAQIKTLKLQLSALEEDPGYLKEKEFSDKLDSLLGAYGKSLRDIVLIFEPESVAPEEPGTRKKRGPRKGVKYRNPHTNEILVTAGGNNRVLKEWKKQYPQKNVKDWIEGDAP